MYTENYKTLMKEIEVTNEWKDVQFQIETQILLKFPYYPRNLQIQYNFGEAKAEIIL